MTKKILLLSLAAWFTGTASAGDLVVHVAGLNSAEGLVRLGLYDAADGFGDEDEAITVQEALAAGEPLVLRILDVPAGEYAIQAFHDEDGDHNFDHLAGLFPREGYGFSVNDDMGAEENFASARFSHGADGDTEVTVYMRYCGNREEKSAGKTLSCWISFSP